jgi:hypothetical protein
METIDPIKSMCLDWRTSHRRTTNQEPIEQLKQVVQNKTLFKIIINVCM